MKIKHFTMAIALFAVTLVAPAQEFKVGQLSVHNPWARPLPPVSKNGAAYLSVTNHAMHAERLVSASTPIAGHVEFHTHVRSGEMMMMQRLEAVEIGAHGTVNMVPGGMHVMLIGMKKPLIAGESFALTLNFENAGSTVVAVTIEARANSAQMPTMQHAPPAMQHGKPARK